MPKPLRSEIRNPPNRQFAHFGVLDTGGQNKSAFFGSIVFNIVLALIAIIIGASVKKQIEKHKAEEISFVVPLKEKPPEPPKPKVPPPPPPKLPPPPKPLVTPEPPKIKIPDPPKMDIPKPVPVPTPKIVPVVVPAPPKIQVAAAAPAPVKVNLPQNASVPNHQTVTQAVQMGHPDSPVAFKTGGPAVAAVNTNIGMPHMPASNSGAGVAGATKVNMGSGSPGGSTNGTVAVAVAGVKMGCVGCTGTSGNGTKVQAAQIAVATAAPPPAPPPAATKAPVRTAPQVLYKPKPVYTSEATAKHIEGTINVKVRVAASGAVTVLGVVNSLGYGLDESAKQCAAGIRFKPAVDASGNPIEWEGVVSITFQMA